jgi:Spy/CpxP family protein refolding chaperone
MMMETRGKTKWQIRLAVLMIFVIGFVAGALAMNFYRSRLVSSSSGPMRGGRFERVFEQLNLTPDQKNQVRVIFDEARAQLNEIRKESGPKSREVRKQTDDRLQAVLTPEQWEQFQQIMEDFRGARPHRRDRPRGQR